MAVQRWRQPLWLVRLGIVLGFFWPFLAWIPRSSGGKITCLAVGALWQMFFLYGCGWWSARRDREGLLVASVITGLWVCVVWAKPALYLAQGDLRATTSGLAGTIQWVVGVAAVAACFGLVAWGHALGAKERAQAIRLY